MSDDPKQPDSIGVAEEPAPFGLMAAYLRNKADPEGAERRAREWAEQNAEAIRSYNAFVEKHGVFGGDLRTW